MVFGNLKIENHEFKYQLSKEFFELFDNEESKNGDVNVLINLERSASHLDLEFIFKGWIQCDCSVCLSEIQYPVSGKHYLHVKLTEKILPDEADIIYLDRNAYKMDLTQLLYEYLFLSLPYRKVCEDSINKDKCDTEFIERLEEKGSKNEETDPQWDKLKELFKKK